jgi:inorganic pyrophosphatase
MVVEIPKGSSNKYEYDKELGAFRLNRVLYSAVHYHGDLALFPELWPRMAIPLMFWRCNKS